MSFEEKLFLKKHIKTNLERLKTELTCQVCFRLFRDPQTLSCSHSYCKSCIKQLLQNSKTKSKFACPQCRRPTSRREASHADQMLATLVGQLHEFWDIMPPEIGCDALTQNTQYYNEYTVPKHMRASQLLSKHKKQSIETPNEKNAQSDSDSNSSQLTAVSLTSNKENETTNPRRVTFNSNPEIELILPYDKEEEESASDDTNHNHNHSKAEVDDEPLYTEEDLHFLSQNRPESPVKTHTIDTTHLMDIDEGETSSIVSDADLSEPMFSLDPDAHNMAGYTLDFGMDSIVEQEEEEEEQIQHVQGMEIDEMDHQNNHNEQQKDEKQEIPIEDDQKQSHDTIRPKASTKVSVSTRSRRKNKKHKSKTSHLLQSKSFMSSQLSQIVLDMEEPPQQADVSYVVDAIHEDDEDIDMMNDAMNDNPTPVTIDIPIESKPKPVAEKRPKSVGKRKKKRVNKKQKDELKLEAIGLTRTDFVEGDLCSVCCEEVDDIGVYCDGCDVFVHMQCYGITRKPTRKEEWFCDPCTRDLNLMRDNGRHMECVICETNTDHAYKAVKKKNTWAHTSCALWITGCNFVNKKTLSPISIDDVDPDRYKLRCIFCKKRGGACLQCELCTNSFHVPCGLRGTAMLELRDGDGDRCYFHSFCPLHTDEASRKSVPDNNHDFPVGPKRGRKRKREETDDDDASKRNKVQNKKRKLKSTADRPVVKAPLLRSPDVRKRKLEQFAPVILCSKLTAEQIGDYDAFKEKFGNVVTFTSQWKPNVTHLVTSATSEGNEKILSARTIKYFQSVIAGCWVMCFDWIEECLCRNTLIEESSYEVLGDLKGRGGARKSRQLRKKKSDNGLFSNVICVVASEFKFARLDEDLRGMFRMGGAKMYNMLPYHWSKDRDGYKKEVNGKNAVFVYDPQNYDMTQKQIDFCNTFGVLPIGYQQVFDTISNYKPISHRILNA